MHYKLMMLIFMVSVTGARDAVRTEVIHYYSKNDTYFIISDCA